MASLIVIDGIVFSLQAIGGVGVYFRELLSRVSNTKHDFLFLSYTNRGEKNTFGVPAQHCDARFAERYRDCVVPAATALFHSTYYRLPDDRSVPIVTTVHDFTYERFVKGLRRSVHSWQKFRAIREADAVICVSENTRRDLMEYLPDVDDKRVSVIHNGVSEAFFVIDGYSRPSSQRPYVLFVGSRGGYKNFDRAVQAVGMVSELSLAIVGGELQAAEVALLERWLPERYEHKGVVSAEALNELYNGATCLLYPSSYEGFGLPVVESMKAGCPVVAVRGSSITEVSGEAAVLVDSPDGGELATSIRTCMQDDSRSRIIAQGLAQARKFSWERTFSETMNVYRKVMER